MGDSIKEQTTRPPPNRGASIPDTEAAGPDSITIAEWRRTNAIDPAAQIRLVKLSHMCYQHPNLPDIITFLQDFGMRVVKQTDDKVWLRGYGTDPYVYYAQRGPLEFLGGTFLVESLADLKRASRLPGASAIKDLDDAPGGGRLVTVRDPEGFPVNLLFGQEEAEAGTLPPKLEANSEADKPRTRKFLRFQPGPAGVHKLGHFGLCVQQFDEQVRWYTKTFNLIPSDFIYVPTDGDRKMVAMFAHIDRGQDNVDHHTFFVASNPTSHVHHSSYEVHDLDTQQLGHQWLARKGYKSVWGIGRHLLGSQIFDYWWDTSGFMVEHYADGDLVNEDTPIGFTKAGHESLAVWGPEVPEGFRC